VVYELIADEDQPMLQALNKNLKFYRLEETAIRYYCATIIGSNQRVFGFFRKIDMDMKTALKINICIPENEKSVRWE
jgi:hypothetical protein